jgi:hypothetical protein
VQAPAPLDPDVLRPVDHDLRDRFVGQELLDRAVTHRVIGDLLDQALPVGHRDPALLGQPGARLDADALAQHVRLQVGVRQLRAEVRDQPRVHAVAHFGKGVLDDLRLGGPDGGDAFAQLHGAHALRSSRRRRPSPTGVGRRSAA